MTTQTGREKENELSPNAEGLAALSTEGRNPHSAQIDQLDTLRMLEVINAEDQRVAPAVREVLPQVAQAVELVARARRAGGRLIYLGAGTSGRLGLLDAVECPPTFGTAPDEVLGLIAGGEQAFLRAVEGAEDDPGRAAADLAAVELAAADVVVGLAASGRTPYVLGGLRHARLLGASTVAVSCNPASTISSEADIAIEVLTGPEVLTGSTRLKAGTAQKLVCNMISTGSMIRTGKVYGNLMIDVRPTNLKLIDRARRIVAEAAGVDPELADAALAETSQHAKTAVVMLLAECDATRAQDLLDRADGDVRRAIVSQADT